MKKLFFRWLTTATINALIVTLMPLTAIASSPDLEITDIDIDNRIFDPWDDEEAEITFEINKDAYMTLEILDEDNDTVDLLIYDDMYDEGEHTIFWDGRDEYGDYVEQGDYTFELTASLPGERDKEEGYLEVKRTSGSEENNNLEPNLEDVFVTKESFDPDRNEITEIVFTLNVKADVKVTIYDEDGDEVEEIYDRDNKKAGTYKVEFDGNGYDEGTYIYDVYARNSEGSDSVEGEIEIEEDDNSNSKPNIYKDSVDDVIYEPGNNKLNIYFKLDKDAEVTIEIRDDDYVIAEVIEDEDMPEGGHTISWNGKDKYGDYVEDGIYQYKIIAANNKGKDTEKGNILVDNSSQATYGDTCAGFKDVNENYVYCEAIEWVTEMGIFEGYNDATFAPNAGISRAEALKVIFETLGINLYGTSYVNFKDTYQYAWYMPYVNTALYLGVVNGYSDNTFRPNNGVTVAEALKMLLETGEVANGVNIPVGNYGQPYYDVPSNAWYINYAWAAKEHELTANSMYLYPNSEITRGEMADMLYRYYEAGLTY